MAIGRGFNQLTRSWCLYIPSLKKMAKIVEKDEKGQLQISILSDKEMKQLRKYIDEDGQCWVYQWRCTGALKKKVNSQPKIVISEAIGKQIMECLTNYEGLCSKELSQQLIPQMVDVSKEEEEGYRNRGQWEDWVYVGHDH